MPRYGNNARGVRKMIADDKAEAHVQRTQPKVCGCGYPPHVGRCQPKLMPSTPQQAVIMLQHIINLFPDEPDVIFVAAVAIADIATEAANNGTIVDPLMGSDFVPPSPAPVKTEIHHHKEANQMTARSIIDEMMDVGAERLGGYDERGQWHQPDEPEPVNFHFIRGAKNGIILSIIIDALLLLALYGYRLALWIDGVAR